MHLTRFPPISLFFPAEFAETAEYLRLITSLLSHPAEKIRIKVNRKRFLLRIFS